MIDNVYSALRQAAKQKVLVQIARHDLEPPEFYLHGFVLDCSPAFVLMQMVSDRFDLDGFEVLRTQDITMIDSDFPQRRFLDRALGLKNIQPHYIQEIDLSNTRNLLKSIEELFPLVVIHRELVSEDECEVGRIKMGADEFYTLKYISPTAEWEDDDQVYRYSDVTRVCFGGAYETTLALVAGLIV